MFETSNINEIKPNKSFFGILYSLLNKKNKKFIQNFIVLALIVILFVYGIILIQNANFSIRAIMYFLVIALLGLAFTLIINDRNNKFVRFFIYFFAFAIIFPLLIKFYESTFGISIVNKSKDTLRILEQKRDNAIIIVHETPPKTSQRVLEVKSEIPVKHNFHLQGRILNENRTGMPGLIVTLSNTADIKILILETDNKGYFDTTFQSIKKEIDFKLIVKEKQDNIILTETATFKSDSTTTRIIR